MRPQWMPFIIFLFSFSEELLYQQELLIWYILNPITLKVVTTQTSK
ncbi:hypothetical protein CDIF1296T_phi019 [Peptoclostridium phage phiCDIF1296T]|uniref:Uncharacterized protein n=1 Tax=Clostridioides difficile ATCC 9689 = DSM 1296 TaxID=1121308 RepID=A0ACA7UNB9_CLODI|nr:hypothetical protein PHICD211_29017 [Clostridium phage phiCD211]AKP44693.1 hypothetical protein CDIF1296T_phi019 [Peptoclostridium phage phiCDIF1296T]CEK40400.1 hypothetical protein PHICD211_29017 [Clostridium phage phiCD211]